MRQVIFAVAMTSLPSMYTRILCLFLGVFASASAFAAGPLLTSPENGAVGQPSDVTFSWEGGPITNVFVNGGFEQAVSGWFGNVGAGDGRMRAVVSTNSAEGRAYGALQLLNPQQQSDLFVFQTLAIPRTAVTARLSWKDYTTGSGNFSGTYRVAVTPTTGVQNPLVVHEGTPGINGTDEPWVYHEADLTAYAGRTVVVEFNLLNSARERMGLLLDDVRLELFPEPVLYELYVGPTPSFGLAQRVNRSAETSFTVSGLAPGSTNYWRVVQLGGGVQLPSRVYSFVVEGTFVGPLVAPLISAPGISDGMFQAAFTTQTGHTYRVERTASLNPAQWESTGASVDGTGQIETVRIPLPAGDSGYYRVVAE